MMASCTLSVRSQMPGVGVTATSTAVLSPSAFTARSWKVWRTSLVRPVTVKPASFAPPTPLFSIGVKSIG